MDLNLLKRLERKSGVTTKLQKREFQNNLTPIVTMGISTWATVMVKVRCEFMSLYLPQYHFWCRHSYFGIEWLFSSFLSFSGGVLD